MKIREIEQMLSIPRATIRFYEKQGLIRPARDPDNEYREYSEEDVQRLKKILILRKLGFPVAAVSELLDDENSDFQKMLETQIEQLEAQKAETEAVIALCREMKAESVSVNSMDEDYWWDEIRSKEKAGYSFFDHLSADVQIALYQAASQVEYSSSHGPRTPDLIWNPMQKTTGHIQSFWKNHTVIQAVLVILVLILSLIFVIFISSM